MLRAGLEVVPSPISGLFAPILPISIPALCLKGALHRAAAQLQV